MKKTNIKFLFYILTLLNLLQSITDEAQDTIVYYVHVNIDPIVIDKLEGMIKKNFARDYNALASIKSFCGGVFDIINEELLNKGIQIKGDFTKLIIKHKDATSMTKEGVCPPNKSVIIDTEAFMETEENVKDGFNIYLFYGCKGSNSKNRLYVHHVGECRTGIGIEFFGLEELKKNIIHGISMAIEGLSGLGDIHVSLDDIKSNNLRMRGCLNQDGFVGGKNEQGLREVRHLGIENLIIGTDYRSLQKSRKNHIFDKVDSLNAFATEDYSNSSEVYDDFESKPKLF